MNNAGLRTKAYGQFRLALKQGRLARPAIADCGHPGRIHGHHNDYSQPTVVEWLCPRCHAARHHEQLAARRRAGVPTKDAFVAAFRRHSLSATRTADFFGVSRQTIHDWMAKHEIKVERRVVNG